MVLIRVKKKKKIIILKLVMWDNVFDYVEEINLFDFFVWKLISLNYSLYYIILFL